VDVEDSLEGFLGIVYYDESPKTFEYIRTYGPYDAVGVYIIDNTATATGIDTGTEWTASATVEIHVFDITVSKSLDTYWERVFEWSIEKLVEAAQLKPFINDQIEVRYTINVVKTIDSDTFIISGFITIVNNNPAKSTEVYVIDKIYDDMIVVASQDLGSHTIAPGDTLELYYEINFVATPGKTYTNKAHVELNNYHWNYMGDAIAFLGTTEFTYSEDFTYTEPDVKINDAVMVTDAQNVPAGLALISSDYPGGWITNVDATFVVNKVVKAVELGTWILSDEAFAEGDAETWSSGEKTLTFNVYDIDVSKTAEPWWERSYDWTIDKSVEPTELILYKGDTGTVTYTITIAKTVAGDLFKVYGTVTIVNNNPEKYAIVHVTDIIYAPDDSPVGSQDLGTHTIAPLATLELDYEIFFTPEIGTQYTNVAHVDLENYKWNLDTSKDYLYDTEFTGAAFFTFTVPTSLVDDTATVEEVEIVPPEFSFVVDYGPHGPPPWTLTDSTVIVFTKDITEVSGHGCNWYEVPNTVTLTETDTGAVRQASALVRIHVVVPYAGTIGYWMNHPEAWQVISPDDPFPWTTGRVADYTYMQVLETAPSGDASIQLARQYIGAKLNQIVFGVPSAITDVIAETEASLAMHPAGSDPQDAARDYAVYLADILEAYNSGKPPWNTLPPP